MGIENFRGADGNRHIEAVADVPPVKTSGRNAEDLKRLAVQPNRAADGAWRAAIAFPPERVAQHCESRAAAPIVIGGKEPSGRGTQAEGSKIVAADPDAIGVIYR